MSRIKNFLLLLLIISLQNLIKAQIEPESIPIDYSSLLDLNGDKYFVINYSNSDLNNINYLTITSQSIEYNNPGFIYISFTQEHPSADDRIYLSQNLGKNEVIINVSKLKNYSKIYINLHSLEQTQVQFEVKTSKTIDLKAVPDNKKFKLSDINTLNYKITEDIHSKKIMIYGIGENVDYFTMKVLFYEFNKVQKEYNTTQKFDNGYGIIIDLKELKSTGNFEIKLFPNKRSRSWN